METVKLHTCNWMWLHGPHPCWKVKKALDDANVPYEVVEHPRSKRKRDDIRALSGQDALPLIEFADGRAYRAESRAMIARITAGALFDG
jgi:glutathione S-transferase